MENRKVAFTSVYTNLLRNTNSHSEGNRRFYCEFEKYTVVVEFREDMGEENAIVAMVSPSSKALRWSLQTKNIPFRLPLDKKKGVAYYDSLEPDQVGQLNREKYEQSSITQLLVEGEDNVTRMLKIFIEKFDNEYLDLTFTLPRIHAPFRFTNAVVEQLVVKSSGQLTRTTGTNTTTIYRIELSGTILPFNVEQIYHCLKRYCDSESLSEPCEMTVTTVERTRNFNIPFTENLHSSVEDSLFISKIEMTASSHSKFMLSHE